MKMPKDRKLDRRQSLQRFAQIDAADIFSREDPVEKAMRRSVRDQDLRVRGNQIPVRLDFGPALAIERPVIEPRLDRAAPKFAPADRGATVVEIDDRRRMGLEERDGGGRFSLEKKVVVTGDQNLVFVWLGFPPRVASPNFLTGCLNWDLTEGGVEGREQSSRPSGKRILKDRGGEGRGGRRHKR